MRPKASNGFGSEKCNTNQSCTHTTAFLACSSMLALALLTACASGSPEPTTTEPPPTPESDEAEIDVSPTPDTLPDAGIAPGGERDETDSISFLVTGDLVVSRRLVISARDQAEAGGWMRMLEGYRRQLEPEDLVLLNVESPLVNDVNPMSTGWPPILGAPSELATALDETGVHVVSVANNHSYDQGHLGLQRTMVLLEDLGIAAVGAAAEPAAALHPRLVRRRGWTVAILAATNPMNIQVSARGHQRIFVARLWQEERVIAAVERARSEADLVVLLLHWSHDFEPRPTRSQRALAHRLVNAGADFIVGTGPHVLQPVERLESERGEALVAYSLGNLVSSMAFSYRLGVRPRGYVHPANVLPESRDGVALRVRFTRGVGGEIHLERPVGVPLWTSNNHHEHRAEGVPLDIRVGPLQEAAAERRPLIEAALGPEVERVTPPR